MLFMVQVLFEVAQNMVAVEQMDSLKLLISLHVPQSRSQSVVLIRYNHCGLLFHDVKEGLEYLIKPFFCLFG